DPRRQAAADDQLRGRGSRVRPRLRPERDTRRRRSRGGVELVRLRRAQRLRGVSEGRRGTLSTRLRGTWLHSAAHGLTSVFSVDELIEVRRSRRARRWTLSVPWGSPPLLTVPAGMADAEIDGIVERHRAWIADERRKQRPRLGLDPKRVSET